MSASRQNSTASQNDEPLAGRAEGHRIAATRQAILHAADRQFARFGYTKTAIADIAAGCAMSPPNLYNFFPAKIDIAAAVVEQRLSALIADQKQNLEIRQGPAADCLRTWLMTELEVTYRLIESHPMYLTLLDRVGRDRPAVANRLLAVSRTALEEILARGKAEGDLQVENIGDSAEAIQIAMLKFRFPQGITGLGLEDLRREASLVIDHLLSGLGPRGVE